jgi:hypothetical protein
MTNVKLTQIRAQTDDDGVDHEAMNDDRAEGRREPDKQGTEDRNVARRHLIPRDSHNGAGASAAPWGAHGVSGEDPFLSPVRSEIKSFAP